MIEAQRSVKQTPLMDNHKNLSLVFHRRRDYRVALWRRV